MQRPFQNSQTSWPFHPPMQTHLVSQQSEQSHQPISHFQNVQHNGHMPNVSQIPPNLNQQKIANDSQVRPKSNPVFHLPPYYAVSTIQGMSLVRPPITAPNQQPPYSQSTANVQPPTFRLPSTTFIQPSALPPTQEQYPVAPSVNADLLNADKQPAQYNDLIQQQYQHQVGQPLMYSARPPPYTPTVSVALTSPMSLPQPTSPMSLLQPTAPMSFPQPTSPMSFPQPTSPMSFPQPTPHMSFPQPTSHMSFPQPTSPMSLTQPTSHMSFPQPTSPMSFRQPTSSMGLTPPHFSSTIPPMPSVPSAYPAQHQQPRINPDQLPDYVRTRKELASRFGTVYETGLQGVPPSSTLNITYKDTGNASPRFVRSTLYSIPTNQEMTKNSQLPIALTVSPMALMGPSEGNVPIASFNGQLPVRCNRCKAYMNPYVRFIDGGNRFQCSLCETHTPVPAEYFAHIDYNGKRVDTNSRAELFASSYDIIATVDYCQNKRLPNPAKYIFVVDVTYSSVKSGLTKIISEKLRSEVLNFLPRDIYTGASDASSPVQVGLITFDSRLHFYNFKSFEKPEVFIVPDVNDPFIPLLDGFFVESGRLDDNFDNYLNQIFAMFERTHETSVAVGPAIQAACDALKASESPGKIFVFATTIPTDANIPGKLAIRDDQSLLGTDKEKTALSPTNKYYTELGKSCVSVGCGVDLFLFANQFVDVASLSEVSKISGGQVYYYRYFSPQHDTDRFLADLRYTVSRPTAFNATMRIRSSNGIRATDFLGSFYMQTVTDMEFGSIDCDKAVEVEFNYDDKLPENSIVHFQIALLYTSIAGRRLIRIHNFHLPSSSNLVDIYQSANLEAIVSYIIKVAARSLLISTISQIRSNVISQVANILSCYRSHSPNAANSTLLLLPEPLKMIPLFVNSLLKCDAIGGTQSVSPDQKSWLLNRITSMGCDQIVTMLYPSLYAMNFTNGQQNGENVNTVHVEFTELRCMYEILHTSKIYILENGLTMWIWIGNNVDPSVINALFGVSTINDVKLVEFHDLPALNNDISSKVREFIMNTRISRKNFMKVNLVKQGHSLEMFFRNYLVEDSGIGGSKSYAGFLYELHGEIRQLGNQ